MDGQHSPNGTRSDVQVSVPQSRFAERHYAVCDIADLWGLSPDMVRKLFEGEPGVVVIGHEAPIRGKRRYVTLRIPESVLERVHRRLSKF